MMQIIIYNIPVDLQWLTTTLAMIGKIEPKRGLALCTSILQNSSLQS